jgi:hypothetical protein
MLGLANEFSTKSPPSQGNRGWDGKNVAGWEMVRQRYLYEH